jgi:CheY-like chemotaxis protein
MREEAVSKFHHRVLLVDADDAVLDAFSAVLREHDFGILIAHDGFEALQTLRGGIPDLLVTELNLPRMSGFELLSVVRTRFPQIGVIAISSEYSTVSLPNETLTDAFVSKGPNAIFELVETAHRVIEESPLRASKAKSTFAPVWIPRSSTGYVILSCPECMRSFSVPQQTVKPEEALTAPCVFCEAAILYRLNPGLAVSYPDTKSHSAVARERSEQLTQDSRRLLKESHDLRGPKKQK